MYSLKVIIYWEVCMCVCVLCKNLPILVLLQFNRSYFQIIKKHPKAFMFKIHRLVSEGHVPTKSPLSAIKVT